MLTRARRLRENGKRLEKGKSSSYELGRTQMNSVSFSFLGTTLLDLRLLLCFVF